jgi:hypothetical protein
MGFDPADVDPVASLDPLPTAQIASLLRASAAHIATELTALGERWAQWRPAPGE